MEKKGKKVAVVGSGPAGIACAGDLAAMGYDVTVFEKLSYAGGILTYGIPQFVLPNEVVNRHIDTLKAQGVEIVTSSPIDKSKSIDALFADGKVVEIYADADKNITVIKKLNLVYF